MVGVGRIEIHAIEPLATQVDFAQAIDLIAACARVQNPDNLEVEIAGNGASCINLPTQKARHHGIESIQLLRCWNDVPL